MVQESANLNAAARSTPRMDGDGDEDGELQMDGHRHDTVVKSPPLYGCFRSCALSAVCDVSSTPQSLTFHGHHGTQDASLWCGTESLLDPKLLETLRLDTFD